MDDLETRLRSTFRWVPDKDGSLSDPASWWGDPLLLADLGPALARLHEEVTPTVVVGIEARGFVLGPLVALALGTGFGEIRKDVS